MRRTYQESKLNDVQYLLGDYFDIAMNQYYQSPEKAYKRLLVSKYSQLIEKGNLYVVSGKSGYELFYDVMEETTQDRFIIKESVFQSNKKVLWAGWMLAYLQWSTARSFDNIYDVLPFERIIDMYHPYHEMDERRFLDDVYKKYFLKETNLKKFRKRNKLKQRELASLANVSVRTIQMLEQRQNDINQTKAVNLFNISRALNCSIEDLLE